GNLVSPAWWDEIWLNEAFATWMASKAMEVAAPELQPGLGMIRWVNWVMSTDSQKDARAIRQPILSTGDIYNAFDGITYGKGAGVLRMIEMWIGEDTFRTAV